MERNLQKQKKHVTKQNHNGMIIKNERNIKQIILLIFNVFRENS